MPAPPASLAACRLPQPARRCSALATRFRRYHFGRPRFHRPRLHRRFRPHRLSLCSAGASRTRRITGRARRIASRREQNDPTQKNRGAMRAGLHLMSHATLAAVQNLPDVFPDMPVWQSGSVGSRHALLSAHIVVHAANIVGLLMQLKQVVPAPQGCPQSGTNVVHLPCRQVTPAWSVNRRREPSSAVGCPAAQPQRG